MDIPKETIREIKEENKGKMERDEMKKVRKDVNRVTKKHISKLKHSKTIRIGAKTDNDMRRSIRKRIYPIGGKKKTVKNKIRFSLW